MRSSPRHLSRRAPSGGALSLPLGPRLRAPHHGSRLVLLALAASLSAASPRPLHSQNVPTSFAPRGSHATWKVTAPAEVARGAAFEVVAAYETAKGWHIYAPDHKGTGVPTKITVESPHVRPKGDLKFPKPIVKEEPALGETHRLLEGKDELRLPVELSPDAPAGEIELKVVVSFMTCDAAGCDPPSKIEQKLTVKVGAAAEQKSGTTGTAPVSSGSVASAKGVALGTPVELKKKHVTWRIAAAKEAPAGGTILVSAEYETAESWHLYAPDHESPQGLGIATKLSTSFELDGRPEFPAPKVVKDENTLGETHRHLEGKGEIRWKLKVPAGQKAGSTRFDVRIDFMTCSTEGTCDLPDKAETTFETAILPAATPPAGEGAKADGAKAENAKAVNPEVDGGKDEAKAGGAKVEPEGPRGQNAAAAPPPPANGPAVPAQAGAPVLPGGGTMLGLVFAAVVGGLIALIMPCTYPMIPLTITFFTKQAEARGGSVLGLALAYGAGIVLVFDIIGLLFAAPIASFAAHAITNLVFCAIFLVFALSFFGLFEIRLPSFVNNLVAGFVQRESASVAVAAARPRSGAPAGTAPSLAAVATGPQSGVPVATARTNALGAYLGVFLLGTTLVVTSFTCTAPFVGGLLGVAGQIGASSVLIGMTCFGITVAAPFVALSFFPSRVRSLPRAGSWMHTLKVYLGFLEVFAALKFFSQADLAWGLGVLPRELFLASGAALMALAGLYLLRVFRLHDDPAEGVGGWQLLFGIITILAGTYLFLGVLGYKLDRITEALSPNYSCDRLQAQVQGGPAPEKFVEDDFEGGLERARREGKLAFVNFTGVTCTNCRLMEVSIFPLPEIAKALARYVEIRLHTDKSYSAEVTARSARFQELKVRLTQSEANPIYVILDPARPEVPLGIFPGADLTGRRFLEFLEQHAR
jgi:thiol:disulfide interchange protein